MSTNSNPSPANTQSKIRPEVKALVAWLYGQVAANEVRGMSIATGSFGHNNEIYFVPSQRILLRCPKIVEASRLDQLELLIWPICAAQQAAAHGIQASTTIAYGLFDEDLESDTNPLNRPYSFQYTLPGVALSDEVNGENQVLYDRFSVPLKKKFARDYIDFLNTMEGIRYSTYGLIAARDYAQLPDSQFGPRTTPIANLVPTVVRLSPQRDLEHNIRWHSSHRGDLVIAPPRYTGDLRDPNTGERWVEPPPAAVRQEPNNLFELLIHRIQQRLTFDNNEQLRERRLVAILKLRNLEQTMRSLTVDNCVLYHSGLQRRNLLADIDTAALTGIVDWDGAESRPKMFARASSSISFLWAPYSIDDDRRADLMWEHLPGCRCSKILDGTIRYCDNIDCQIRRYCRRYLERTIPGYWEDARSIQAPERLLYSLATRESTWAGGDLDLIDHIVTCVENRMKEDSQDDFDYSSDNGDDDDDDDDDDNDGGRGPSGSSKSGGGSKSTGGSKSNNSPKPDGGSSSGGGSKLGDSSNSGSGSKPSNQNSPTIEITMPIEEKGSPGKISDGDNDISDAGDSNDSGNGDGRSDEDIFLELRRSNPYCPNCGIRLNKMNYRVGSPSPA
jgi:uncharacterized membrane protein YgcG